MKSSISFFFLLIALNTSFAQTTNVKAGLWSDIDVWANKTIPTDTTNVILNYDITIDIDAVCHSLKTNGHNVTVNTGIKLVISGLDETVTDRNGNVYNTVRICDQVWSAKNLHVSRYRNGNIIPQVTDSLIWVTLKTGAWCWYKNDSATYSGYGKLYNWYAVNDPRGLAPAGYHVPRKDEWDQLATCLGGKAIAGGVLKETGTTHWLTPNTNATNTSKFTALPGGTRTYYGGAKFESAGIKGTWWSSTKYYDIYPGANYDTAFVVSLYYSSGQLYPDYWPCKYGMSVRFIKDKVLPTLSTIKPHYITSESAICGGTVFDSGTSPIIERGVCWSKSAVPVITDNKIIATASSPFEVTINGLDTSTTYYARAYAINTNGISYGNALEFKTLGYQQPDSTFTDPRDGQVYTFRHIGTQVWMTMNMNYVSINSWCNNDEAGNCSTYGRLYTFTAANSYAAPPGWHVPSATEWTTLLNYLGGREIAGNALRATTLWAPPTVDDGFATNISGFSALPGGYRNTAGQYNTPGNTGEWWTSTNFGGISAADASLYYNNSYVYGINSGSDLNNAYSVRCVRNN
ncbi:MAG: FISUMP domain-containing protein [Bacteroidota bacterium]